MDTIEVVNAIRNGNRAAAIEKINDLLYGKAAEAMGTYKQVVANTFFDTEEDYEEETPEETEQ